MKLSIPKEPLLKAIRTAESFLFIKNLNKADLLIDASSDITRIFATDKETSVIIKLNANITENGSMVIYGKKFNDILAALPNDDVELTAISETVSIKSLNKNTKALFNLKILPKDEYPKMPEQKNDNIFKLKQSILKQMISKVISSASNDDTSYALNGILFNIKRDSLKLVATDGRRLSLITENIEGTPEEKNVIVSKKVLGELEKMLGEEGECQIGLSDNQIFFYFDNIYISSTLIEGDYPDYQQVIPNNFNLDISFNTAFLTRAVKRISTLLNENYTRITFSFNNETVSINSADPDLGDATEEIPIDSISKPLDENFIIGFNAFFLMDVLKVINNDTVLFRFNKNTNPALIMEKNIDKYLSVIMPMKLT